MLKVLYTNEINKNNREKGLRIYVWEEHYSKDLNDYRVYVDGEKITKTEDAGVYIVEPSVVIIIKRIED